MDEGGSNAPAGGGYRRPQRIKKSSFFIIIVSLQPVAPDLLSYNHQICVRMVKDVPEVSWQLTRQNQLPPHPPIYELGEEVGANVNRFIFMLQISHRKNTLEAPCAFLSSNHNEVL